MIKQLKQQLCRWRSLYAIASGVIFVGMSNAEVHPVLRVYLVLLEIQAITALIYFISHRVRTGRKLS